MLPSVCEDVPRQVPWQLESELAAKMEREEQTVFTFYYPEVPKVKGDRRYKRVRRYLVVVQREEEDLFRGGSRQSVLKTGKR